MEHLNGGIIFLIMTAFAFYILGFTSDGWERSGDEWIGLWMNCSTGFHSYSDQPWHKAAQAMMSIGLIFLVFAMAALFVLYRKIYDRQKLHDIMEKERKKRIEETKGNKTGTTSEESATEPISVELHKCQWAVFFILTFFAATFMGIGFFVYGAYHSYRLHWSFAFCIIGTVFCVLTFVYGLWSYCTSFNNGSMKLTCCIHCIAGVD